MVHTLCHSTHCPVKKPSHGSCLQSILSSILSSSVSSFIPSCLASCLSVHLSVRPPPPIHWSLRLALVLFHPISSLRSLLILLELARPDPFASCHPRGSGHITAPEPYV